MNTPETARTAIGGVVDARPARAIGHIAEGDSREATPEASEISHGAFLPQREARMLRVEIT